MAMEAMKSATMEDTDRFLARLAVQERRWMRWNRELEQAEKTMLRARKELEHAETKTKTMSRARYLGLHQLHGTLPEVRKAIKSVTKTMSTGAMRECQEAIKAIKKAKAKEYQAAYYQKNKARLVAKQKEYSAFPHGKARRKEQQRKYQASPQGKAKRKDLDAKRQATSHRMATLHGLQTTSVRPRAEGGRATSPLEAQALRTNVVRGV